MTNEEIIYYLNQSLQLTVEIQPLAREAALSAPFKNFELSDLENKLVKSKVYLEEIISQLETRYAFILFLKCASIIIVSILLGILVGFLLAHK